VGRLGAVSRVSVREFGHVAWLEPPKKAAECARSFGDDHREERLGGVGALRDEAERIEVHVGPRADSDVGL